ncbi:Tyrosine-protein kinase CpsD [Roseimaritima multifibrata]|uniref:Tyrosine-protein kinase CpsD n=1 Tax=Roseimaritima multifibrata TaxID=1930274 RepID=A0A517MB27_9BACT|nr:division plane positioning ATPase MipZ [Roseimaritima multifibrata]QDS92092.1 Tyrosine-protein kinase CpsD [Roseimaritima multifibrata]
MSKIDQAFVKAFAKERPRTAPPTPESIAAEMVAMGMSSFWVDPSNNDLLRKDEPQSIGQTSTGRRRGSRSVKSAPPVSPPAQAASPSASDEPSKAAPDASVSKRIRPDQATASTESHSIELLRFDRAQMEISPEKLLRARLDASSFPAFTVAHDSLEDIVPERISAADATLPVDTTEEATTHVDDARFVPTTWGDHAPAPATPQIDHPEVASSASAPAPAAPETVSAPLPAAGPLRFDSPHPSRPATEVNSNAYQTAVEEVAEIQFAPASEEADVTRREMPAVEKAVPVQEAVSPNAFAQQAMEQASPVQSLPFQEAPLPVEQSSASAPKTSGAFEAAWEVDGFDAPSIVRELMVAGDMVNNAGQPLAQAAAEGMQAVLVSSPRRGDGRSTLAMALALSAAATGCRVALVDGDWEKPSLADDFQLELEFGWPEAIRGGVPLSETAVHGVEDGVTLFPIVPAENAPQPSADALRQTVDSLRPHFDLILVDGPTADTPLQYSGFQSAIVIHNRQSYDSVGLNHCIQQLRYAGIAHVGVAENFSA